MRRRALLEAKSGSVDGSKATPMSVVFANKTDNTLTIVEGDKWSTEAYPPSTFEPIGIVVIPGGHGVLKDGTGRANQCGVMSLVPMNYSTPEQGGTSEQSTTSEEYIYWGGDGISYSDYNALDISGKSDGLGRYDSTSNGLVNYDYCVIISTSDQTTPTGYAHMTFLPKQKEVGGNAVYEATSDEQLAPSPYADKTTMNSGGFNSAYADKSKTTANCLSDFSGIVNTKIITDLHTEQSDWKTASTITNSHINGYYPAACCCARFKTIGTKAFVDCTNEELRNGAGFWYMPAMGELCYILPRFADINDTIGKLNTAYGVGVEFATNYSNYWSSSEALSNGARILCAYNIYDQSGLNILNVCSPGKNSGAFVRAFLRL